MEKPNWRDPDYMHGPASRIHSAMREWADSKSQPFLTVVIEYHNGSIRETEYSPALKNISYRHDGESYEVEIDIAKKYMYNFDQLGASTIVKLEKAFLRNHNIPFKKVYIK